MDTLHLPRLKLRADDLHDLQIFSTYLQDSLVPLHSMNFNQQSNCFSSLANRFCWEHEGHLYENEPLYHRVHSGIMFSGVKKIFYKGFDHKGETRSLNLLAIQAEIGSNDNTIHLLFSGESEIRLHVDTIKCHLGDLHHPWPTKAKPSHNLEKIQH
jgi:hypothetical protein